LVEGSFGLLPQQARPYVGDGSRRWAVLMHRRAGDLGEDAMTAATALIHNLTVVTRNVRDFDAFGVLTLNPFR
jgi:predicted nucleic acid-binding protein